MGAIVAMVGRATSFAATDSFHYLYADQAATDTEDTPTVEAGLAPIISHHTSVTRWTRP